MANQIEAAPAGSEDSPALAGGFLKTAAFVLRRSDFSETSQVVTLFTKEAGRVEALAKGSRRKANPHDGPFDLLTEIEAVLLLKRAGTMSLVTEARLRNSFPGLRSSLPRLYGSFYVVELLRGFLREGQAMAGLFEFLREALYNMERPGELDSLLFAFELKVLELTGFSVETDICAGCNRTLGGQEPVGFSPRLGGFTCPSCAPPRGGREAALRGIVKNLRALAPRAAARVRIPEPLRAALRRLLGEAVTFVLDRPPRMLRFL